MRERENREMSSKKTQLVAHVLPLNVGSKEKIIFYSYGGEIIAGEKF